MTISRLVSPLAVCVVLGLSLSAWADEYPKVVRRDGQVCVQELAADGSVKESCRAESVVAPSTSASPSGDTGWASRFQGNASSPRLLEGDPPDPKGASRGISELLGGQAVAYLISIIFLATGTSSTIGGLLGSAALGFTLSSLASGLFHAAGDGQAGIGWAFLGNLLGQVASVVITLLAVASSSAVVALFAVLVGGFLPALGASIALELRDTVLRREAAGLAPLADAGRSRGAVVARF